jgi:positive regulator of sigma E activity
VSRLDAAMLCLMLAAVAIWIAQMVTAPVVNVIVLCGAMVWSLAGMALLVTYHRTWEKH